MSQTKVALAAFSLAIALAAPAVAQCPTIPQAVEQTRPRPFITSRISELMIVPLDRALAEADLIVVGTLKREAVYLSSDQCTLYTDYSVLLTRVVVSHAVTYDRRTFAPIVVRTWGGETTIAGVPVKIYDENFRPLTENQPYLLLLKFQPDLKKYEVCDHGAYAFEIGADNRLKAVVKAKGLMDAAIEGNTVDDAIAVVQRRQARRYGTVDPACRYPFDHALTCRRAKARTLTPWWCARTANVLIAGRFSHGTVLI